jgi:AcrR family transcriptional regulator
MTDSTPSRRRYQKNRQGILDAARAIVVDQGVEALSMRLLAERVDYSPAALYKYFGSKEEIFDALRIEGRQISADLNRERVVPGLSMPDTLKQMGLAYLEFARRYPAHYQLTMNPADRIPDTFDDFLHDPEFEALLGFAERALASGEVHLPEPARPVHLAFLMWFVGHGAAMIQNSILKNCPDDLVQVYSEVLDMINRMMC